MASLNISVPTPTPAVDWVALLSKSALSLTASQASNPSFDATLGHLVSDKSGSSKETVSSRVDTAKEDLAKTQDAKTEAARIRKREEQAKEDLGERKDVKNAASQVEEAVERDAASGGTVEGEADNATDLAQAALKRESAKLKVVDPHGMDGLGQMGVREQVATRLLHAEQPQPVMMDISTMPLSLEALRLQLAQLGIGGVGGNEAPTVPTALDAGVRITSAILPSTSLALLAERLAQAQAGDKAVGFAEELASQVGKARATGESAATSESGLRSAISGKEGMPAKPGAPLPAHSPQFSDELMDRVGRMRIFSRGGEETQQMRVTLDPEDLGTLDLRLRVDANNQVHLLITAETDEARNLLQRQMAQLQDALARHNMGFGQVTIEVGDQQQGNQTASQQGFAEHRTGQEGGGVGRGVEEGVQSQPTAQQKGVISANEVSIIV